MRLAPPFLPCSLRPVACLLSAVVLVACHISCFAMRGGRRPSPTQGGLLARAFRAPAKCARRPSTY
eukprot:8073269-Alexandrium_andersonii.AAC.1